MDNICNLHSCDNMDNTCNMVINVSSNGRSYNYFIYIFMSCSNIQIRKKAALQNIKGRNIYGVMVYEVQDLLILGFRVYGLVVRIQGLVSLGMRVDLFQGQDLGFKAQ